MQFLRQLATGVLLVFLLGLGLAGIAALAERNGEAGPTVYPLGTIVDTLDCTGDVAISNTGGTGKLGSSNPLSMFATQDLLLKFEPIATKIPSNHVVYAAHVNLVGWTKAPSGFDSTSVGGGLYRMTTYWEEANACGDSAAANKLWNATGATKKILRKSALDSYSPSAFDRMLEPVSTFGFPAADVANGDFPIDATEIVKQWHSGHWEDQGVLLHYLSSQPTRSFHSREDGTAAYRPKLIIYHTPIDCWRRMGRPR